MISRRTILHARTPDIKENRGERHLLVWGDLAQWMVVDGELASFLTLFDGKRSLKETIQECAKLQKKSTPTVEPVAMRIVAELMKRGILSEKLVTPPIQPEAVRIANVTVNLTNRCNLRCAWCYNAEHMTEEMPIERIMDGIEQGRDILAPDASFIILGGEPFIQFERLLVAIQRAEAIFKPQTLISTNGTLLTESVVEQLASRKINIQVSLDGPDAARNDAQRGAGVFEKACEGIRRLVKAKIPSVLSMAFSRDSVRDFESYLDLALKLGVGEARFIPLRMIGRGATQAASAPDLYAAFEHLLEVLDRRPEFRPLLRRDFFSIAMTICRYTDFRTGCGIGRKVTFIDADGKVYPCPNHLMPEYLCGDLAQDNLAQIVRESPVMQQVRQQYQVCHYERCRDCAFRYWCAGDCRGEVLSIYGDPLKPSPHCEEHIKLMKRMMWLIADGDKRLGLSQELPDGKRAVDSFSV